MRERGREKKSVTYQRLKMRIFEISLMFKNKSERVGRKEEEK
jgi:hypothetical protein